MEYIKYISYNINILFIMEKKMVLNMDEVYIQSNIELNISIIKTIFLLLFTFYTNFKITNRKITGDFKIIKNIFLITLVGIIYGIIKRKINLFTEIVSIVLIISIIFSKEKITKSIIVTSISFAINYLISSITIIINFIFNLTTKLNNDCINLIIIIVCHGIILCVFHKLKRFKNGFLFLKSDNKDEYIDILILNISIVILLTTTILANSEIALARDLTVGISTSAIIMFITIQKSLQLYYKQNLLVQELDETRNKLEKTRKDLEQAEEENLSFSKKSHSIAHKQKALEYKIQQLITNVEIGKEESGEVKDKIKEIERELNRERVSTNLKKTEIPQIDDMLEYMQSECIKNKIEFEVQISGNIHHMINYIVKKDDLEILLADHIKDAIIAINHTDNINRSILVRLGKIDGTYGIYIYDSGIEFEKETLENIGKRPITTHANEGGTGMGFLNTFDTLKKYGASLIINELGEPCKENYTKILMLKFDEKKEFKIISYRL